MLSPSLPLKTGAPFPSSCARPARSALTPTLSRRSYFFAAPSLRDMLDWIKGAPPFTPCRRPVAAAVVLTSPARPARSHRPVSCQLDLSFLRTLIPPASLRAYPSPLGRAVDPLSFLPCRIPRRRRRSSIPPSPLAAAAASFFPSAHGIARELKRNVESPSRAWSNGFLQEATRGSCRALPARELLARPLLVTSRPRLSKSPHQVVVGATGSSQAGVNTATVRRSLSLARSPPLLEHRDRRQQHELAGRRSRL